MEMACMSARSRCHQKPPRQKPGTSATSCLGGLHPSFCPGAPQGPSASVQRVADPCPHASPATWALKLGLGACCPPGGQSFLTTCPATCHPLAALLAEAPRTLLCVCCLVVTVFLLPRSGGLLAALDKAPGLAGHHTAGAQGEPGGKAAVDK